MTDRSSIRFDPIEGRHVRLRALRTTDVEAVFALHRDRADHQYGFQPKMDTLDDAHALITRTHALAEAGTVFHWGVADRTTDAVIGHATLFGHHEESRRAELGYSIAPQVRGRGHATDAVTTLIGHAFGAFALRRLEADVDPRNTASIRLLERLGFAREGFLRERWILGGEVQDAILYGLLERDWATRRSR